MWIASLGCVLTEELNSENSEGAEGEWWDGQRREEGITARENSI
jgi:hypothetical protein